MKKIFEYEFKFECETITYRATGVIIYKQKIKLILIDTKWNIEHHKLLNDVCKEGYDLFKENYPEYFI